MRKIILSILLCAVCFPVIAGQLKVYDDTNDAWVAVGYSPVTQSKSFVLTNPTSTADPAIWRVPYGITITGVHVLCVDGTNIVGQMWEFDANGLNGATVDSSDITATAGTNANDDGTLSNPSIDSGDYLGWKTTSVSGSVTRVIVTYDYTVN